MNLLPKRCVLAIAAVVDVALHARPSPVAAKALAARHDLPPRHLESLLQSLVRGDILKGVRGPRGGYELARERRRISVAEIVRAAISSGPEEEDVGNAESKLIKLVINPLAELASAEMLTHLENICVEDLCLAASEKSVFATDRTAPDFTI